MVFDVLYQWAKNYVKNASSKKKIFVSDDTDKSHLVKPKYQVVSTGETKSSSYDKSIYLL